jgi:hypothetical protein
LAHLFAGHLFAADHKSPSRRAEREEYAKQVCGRPAFDYAVEKA